MKAIKENRKNIILVIIINIVIYFFWRMLYGVNLSSSADKIMDMFFSYGLEGSEVTAMWMKAIPNRVMHVAYSILPALSWYVLFQQGCVFVALSVLSYVLIKRGKNWTNCVLCVVCLLSIGYEGYIQINYIKTAFICCAVACLLVQTEMKLKQLWIVLLWLMGYFWCGEVAILTSIIMCGIDYIKHVKWNKKSVWLMGCVMVLVLMLQMIDFMDSHNQTEEKEVTKYYATWVAIEKNGWPNYTINQNLFETLNISEDEYSLILDANLVSDEIVSTEELAQILKLTENKKTDKSVILSFTRTYPLKFVHLRSFYSLLIVTFLFAISKTSRKKEKMFIIYGGLYLLLGILYVLGMCDNTGTVRGILILGMTLLIGFFEELNVKSKEWEHYYVVTMLVFFMISLANAS